VLAGLIAARVGVEEIGLHDDFLAVGGPPDLDEQISDAIHEWFGFASTPELVRRHPTVAALGAHLGTRRPSGSPLVNRVGVGASGTPLFFFAGGGAPAAFLHAFADALAPRPFYGIQARGLEERALPDRTVPAFARRALREIRRIQPTGPYVVGGYSFGTLMAFELACALIDAGDEVALLVLLDTPAPPWASRRAVRRRGSAQLTMRGEIMAWKRSVRRVQRTTLGVVPRRGLAQYDQFNELQLDVGRRYDPSARCGAPALVVRADDARYFEDPAKELPDVGWGRLLTGPVTCADVPGDHLTMIRRPYVAAVARLVETSLVSGAAPDPE
jgi:thioesterase domain-containing protein